MLCIQGDSTLEYVDYSIFITRFLMFENWLIGQQLR